jgi:hypothetical protein
MFVASFLLKKAYFAIINEIFVMNKTRRSLFYLAFYTMTIGLGEVIFGDKMLKLLGSNTTYGEVPSKIVGVLAFSIGLIVAQAIRYNLKQLYPTFIGFRLLVGAVMLVMYFVSNDPMFLVVFLIGAVGVFATSLSYHFDSKLKK